MTSKAKRKKKAVTLYLPRDQHEAITKYVDGIPGLTLSGLVESLLDAVLEGSTGNSLSELAQKQNSGGAITEADVFEMHGKQVLELSLLTERSLKRLRAAKSEETPG